MQALSIKQPWAWLICAGYKDIENRHWKIGRNARHGPYSTLDVANFGLQLPGRIMVHAGKQSDLTEESLAFIHQIVNLQMDWYGSAWRDVLAFGAIIGEVDIVDCVQQSKSPWFTGPYGFVLANAKLYDKPIPYRGQLGFFHVSLPLLAGEKVKE